MTTKAHPMQLIEIQDYVDHVVTLKEVVENDRGHRFAKGAGYRVRSTHLGRLILEDRDARHMCHVMPKHVRIM